VFEKRVLRRIFGRKSEKGAGGCRRLHEELHNLYSSRNIIRVIKSRRMRRAEHAVLIGEIQYFRCKT
jgi:hypothetical protein